MHFSLKNIQIPGYTNALLFPLFPLKDKKKIVQHVTARNSELHRTRGRGKQTEKFRRECDALLRGVWWHRTPRMGRVVASCASRRWRLVLCVEVEGEGMGKERERKRRGDCVAWRKCM